MRMVMLFVLVSAIAQAGSFHEAFEGCLNDYHKNRIQVNPLYSQIDALCEGAAAQAYFDAASKAFKYADKPYAEGSKAIRRIFGENHFCVYGPDVQLGCYFELRLSGTRRK